MDTRANWLKSFEYKTEMELAAMNPPVGLPTAFVEIWRRDRDAALAGLRRANDQSEDLEEYDEEDDELDAEAVSIANQRAALETALSAVENDTAGDPANARVLPSQPSLDIPKGSAADLLERQIGTCAALIGSIADYIARNDTPTDVCFPFMDRISSMLSSSATAARVVGQLRGIASETKQTFITEKGGKGAGGVPQT